MTLRTYPEIRDRIYELARRKGVRPDWVEDHPTGRTLLLLDSEQKVLARATVPTRALTPSRLARLSQDLEGVFGKDWLQ
ncbi:hypothetical protein [Streptosporangium sp. KLBMP 9127]|nr:hypothetical protein [Streptosporangium sp. KLBMP 9127]